MKSPKYEHQGERYKAGSRNPSDVVSDKHRGSDSGYKYSNNPHSEAEPINKKDLIMGSNESLKVGDEVKLRKDVLVRHARSVPAHLGYTKEQFAWRDTLDKLENKTGKIQRTFESSDHVNVEFNGKLIGINETELVKVEKGKKREVYFAFNKEGLKGITIGAKNRKEALKFAEEIHGKGAKVELFKEPSKTR